MWRWVPSGARVPSNARWASSAHASARCAAAASAVSPSQTGQNRVSRKFEDVAAVRVYDVDQRSKEDVEQFLEIFGAAEAHDAPAFRRPWRNRRDRPAAVRRRIARDQARCRPQDPRPAAESDRGRTRQGTADGKARAGHRQTITMSRSSNARQAEGLAPASRAPTALLNAFEPTPQRRSTGYHAISTQIPRPVQLKTLP